MKNLTVKQVIQILILVIILIFVMQNLSSVAVRFLFFKFELPLFILIVILFFAGFYTARFASSLRKSSTDKKNQPDSEDKPLV